MPVYLFRDRGKIGDVDDSRRRPVCLACGYLRTLATDVRFECAHGVRFVHGSGTELAPFVRRVIADLIRLYNHRRPHHALNMKSPAAVFALAA